MPDTDPPIEHQPTPTESPAAEAATPDEPATPEPNAAPAETTGATPRAVSDWRSAPPVPRAPVVYRGTGQRRRSARRPVWQLVVAILVGAALSGAVIGLSVPVDGRTGWSRLSSSALRAAWSRLTHRDSPPPIDAVWRRGSFVPVRTFAQLLHPAPLQALWGLPVAANYEQPPHDELRAALFPALGADRAALSLNQLWQWQDQHLRQAEFAPVAELAFVPMVIWHDIVDGPKEVFFDVTTAEFDAQLDEIAAAGCTPISMRQWWAYATRGASLPAKPIVLTFDDGYASCYTQVWPRLKARGWPAAYFIVSGTVGREVNTKPKVTWEQLREMHASGLAEIASHSVDHSILTDLPRAQLRAQLRDSRQQIELEVGCPVDFFGYPEGKFNNTVVAETRAAGYAAGIAYVPAEGSVQSGSPFEVHRFVDPRLSEAIERSDAGPLREVRRAPPPPSQVVTAGGQSRDYGPVVFNQQDITVGRQKVPLVWVTGGRPITVHCDYRYAVGDVTRLVDAAAGINGSFFQLAHIRDISNAMLGPVLSRLSTVRNATAWQKDEIALPEAVVDDNQFIPGAQVDIVRLVGRPLVLIGRSNIGFFEFTTDRNSLAACQQLMPDVTDAFVAGGWLVRDGHPLSKAEMDLVATRDHDDYRRRAWFGVDVNGVPVIGATPSSQRSEVVAKAMVAVGVQQGALLDSGFSTSLIFRNDVYVTGHSDRQPSRPVPHMILLEGDIDPTSAAKAVPPDSGEMGNDPGATRANRRRR